VKGARARGEESGFNDGMRGTACKASIFQPGAEGGEWKCRRQEIHRTPPWGWGMRVRLRGEGEDRVQ